VDLVGDDEGVVLLGQFGQRRQLLGGEDPAERVVGLAQDDGSCALGEGRLDPVHVQGAQAVGPGDHRDRDDLAVLQTWYLPERHVGRGGQHHRGPCGRVGPDRQPDTGEHIGQHRDLARVDAQPLVAPGPVRPGLLEAIVAGVAVGLPGDDVEDGGLHRRGHWEVHLRHPQRNDVLGHVVPATGSAGAEPFGGGAVEVELGHRHPSWCPAGPGAGHNATPHRLSGSSAATRWTAGTALSS